MRASLLALVVLAGCGPSAATKAKTAPTPTAPVASTPPAPPVKPAYQIPTKTADVAITVTGTGPTTKILMNGIEVSSKPMLVEIEKVFGKADRTWDQGGANRVHTWDRIGLLVYEPFDGRCISATFPFHAMGSSTFNPTTMFGGSIVIDGKPLTAKTDYATVLARGAEARYTDSLVFDKGDIHVFMTAEGPTKVLDLVEISFWQRGKDTAPTVDDEQVPEPKKDPNGIGAMESACVGGDAKQCTSLAFEYQTGTHVPKDADRSFFYAKKGCDGGHAFGCTTLGYMYDAGRGVTASKAEAKRAWQRACSLGDDVGCSLAK
jgi:hypothetical protein